MTPRVVECASAVHRVVQAVSYSLLVGVIVLLAVTQPDFQLTYLIQAAALAITILGLNLVTGFSGQISLGHSAFFGIGAYATAILVTDHGWPFLATFPVAAVAGLAVGFLVGLPALRISGLYLALVTLALAAAFPVLVKLDAIADITGGANGKDVGFDWRKPAWFGLDVSAKGWRFLVAATVAGLCFLLASNMMRSRVGRALQALRDNPTGAAASGVNLAAWKTGAFAVSAAYAAIGGSLIALAGGGVSPDTLGFLLAVQLITALVLGGIATISGAVIGGMAIVYLPYYSSKWSAGKSFLFFDPKDSGLLANVLYGVALIAVILAMPGGAVSFARKLRGRFVLFVPRLPTALTAPLPGPVDATSDRRDLIT
jgi:branched-chain amino acid transport system permease protein